MKQQNVSVEKTTTETYVGSLKNVKAHKIWTNGNLYLYTCEPKAVEWGVDKRNENKLRDKNKKGFILWK